MESLRSKIYNANKEFRKKLMNCFTGEIKNEDLLLSMNTGFLQYIRSVETDSLNSEKKTDLLNLMINENNQEYLKNAHLDNPDNKTGILYSNQDIVNREFITHRVPKYYFLYSSIQ